jgi:rubrerythrin
MVLFNNYDVLDMALRLERNGISFYGKAAAQAPKELSELLAGLVQMEQRHEQIFTELRAHLTRQEQQVELSDKEGVAAAYMDSLLHGSIVFDPGFDAAAWLAANPTPADILRRGISFEKDTVLFYLSMREMMPLQASTAKIDQVIAEEKGHVALLTGKLRHYVS